MQSVYVRTNIMKFTSVAITNVTALIEIGTVYAHNDFHVVVSIGDN